MAIQLSARKRFFAISGGILLLALTVTGQAQPLNLGDLKQQALDYYKYGGYAHDLEVVDADAQQYVVVRAKQVSKPALVLDIDETSLSNWPEIAANDFGYIATGPCNFAPDNRPLPPCGTSGWDASLRAAAIAPTLALFKTARSNGVAVFFITGRYEKERAATEANLRAAGYAGWQGLVMRPDGSKTASAADFKAPERARIAASGYTIIANVGDQPSDLDRGLAERSFLLPNPFYRIP